MTTNNTPLLFKRRDTINTVMVNVLIAALPALCWSVYVFGFRSLSVCAASVLSAMVLHTVGDILISRKVRFDLSCVVTGVLVGMAMPVSVPLWLPAAASAFAVVVGKIFFGGTGGNLFNPAALGICFSYLTFGGYMTAFTKPFASLPAFYIEIPGEMLDSARTVTSFENLRAGVVDPTCISEELYGLVPGSIGTVSALMLFIGLVYLLLTRTVHFNSALAFLLVYTLLSLMLCYADYEPTQFMELQLLSGNLMFVLTFMLNDYSTTPTTSLGRLIFAVLAAGAIFAARAFGMVDYCEFFVVLALNVLSPVIEKRTYPTVFGAYVRKTL